MEGAKFSHVWNALDRSMELHNQPNDCADYVVLRSRYALRGECKMNKDCSPLPPLSLIMRSPQI